LKIETLKTKKTKVPKSKINRVLNPGPVVLVTTSFKGKTNVMAASWSTPVDSDPPRIAVVIGRGSLTNEFALKSRRFCVNVPLASLTDKVLSCGRCSGRDCDKFKLTGMTPVSGKSGSAVWVDECSAHLECRLVDIKTAKKYDIFIGDVVSAWADRKCFSERWLTEKPGVKLIHHLGGDQFSFSSGARTGKIFKTGKG